MPEAFLHMAFAGKVALVEDPAVAALRIRQDLPAVVVGVPEMEAVGAVGGNRFADVVQPPLLGLLKFNPARLCAPLDGANRRESTGKVSVRQ
jgi:hypothetical protein